MSLFNVRFSAYREERILLSSYIYLDNFKQMVLINKKLLTRQANQSCQDEETHIDTQVGRENVKEDLFRLCRLGSFFLNNSFLTSIF